MTDQYWYIGTGAMRKPNDAIIVFEKIGMKQSAQYCRVDATTGSDEFANKNAV